MTFRVSGWRLLVTLLLVVVGLVVGLLTPTSGPNGQTIVAALLVVAGLFVSATAPQGALRDDEERTR